MTSNPSYTRGILFWFWFFSTPSHQDILTNMSYKNKKKNPIFKWWWFGGEVAFNSRIS
jgi:hypothetical protein